MHRVAVIGSGIAGLGAAWRLATSAPEVRVTLLEAGAHFGGHANTVDLALDGVVAGVDTGFLVFNRRTYPELTRLFAALRVDCAPADMGFSVQVPRADGSPGLEWSGSSLGALFAQYGNLARPRFWRMLADIERFNRLSTALALDGGADPAQTIGDFLARYRFGDAFRDDYLLPMLGSIWSCSTRWMLRFPAATMIRFCHNHGLLQIQDRPAWMTVRGGSRRYVERIVAAIPDARRRVPVRGVRRVPAGVEIVLPKGTERFDAAVLACHSDQALALLGNQASAAERGVLGAIGYQSNRAVLHTDRAVLPSRRNAWAAWNYERAPDPDGEGQRVCIHYLLNRLQPLPWARPVIVSLNPARAIDPSQVRAEFSYEHPVFDHAAIVAQQDVAALQGLRRTWYCGAWCGYGFHEDGLRAGLRVADGIVAWLRGGTPATTPAGTPAPEEAAA